MKLRRSTEDVSNSFLYSRQSKRPGIKLNKKDLAIRVHQLCTSSRSAKPLGVRNACKWSDLDLEVGGARVRV